MFFLIYLVASVYCATQLSISKDSFLLRVIFCLFVGWAFIIAYLLIGIKNSQNSTSFDSDGISTTTTNRESSPIYSKIVGVTYENRQSIVRKCYSGQPLRLEREKNNKYDKNAVAVYNGSDQMLGYLKRELAASIAKDLDDGKKYNCSVKEVTGGSGYTYGLNIMLSRISPPTTTISYIKTSTNSRDSSRPSKKSNYNRYKDYDPTVYDYDYDSYNDNNDEQLRYEDLRPEYDEDGNEIECTKDDYTGDFYWENPNYREEDYDSYKDNNNDDTLSYEDLRPEYDEDGMEIDYADDSGREYYW